jgi:hypothetical protein
MARLGQIHRPRRASQELSSGPQLEEGDGAGDRRGGSAKVPGSGGESSAIHGRHERDHRLKAVHDIISYYETM